MKIAIIGWGSLIWCPGSLRLSSLWRGDGPKLPIEFARISSDERLTLVVHSQGQKVTTYWAFSAFQAMPDAIRNLRERENCGSRCIGTLQRGKLPARGYTQQIKIWLDAHGDVDAVIWTALPSNWQEKRKKKFTIKDALAYLAELEARGQTAGAALSRTREYIRNTPSQIQTRLRRKISRNKEWADNELSDALFES